MRILVLDVDGVLNNYNTKERCGPYIGIDSYHVEILSQIYNESSKIDRTEILLSSSWRLGINKYDEEVPYGYQYLTDKLAEFDLKVYDETPCIKKHIKGNRLMTRGNEITTWLENHKDIDVKGIVVFDDDMFDDFKMFGVTKHLIRTSWYSQKGGLQPKHVKMALDILNKEVGIKRPTKIA